MPAALRRPLSSLAVFVVAVGRRWSKFEMDGVVVWLLVLCLSLLLIYVVGVFFFLDPTPTDFVA